MEGERVFVGGLFLDRVSEKAPAFVITNQSIHVDSFIHWLQENKHRANEKGYIKITGLESKDKTKRYFVVDTWKREEKVDTNEPPTF